MMRPIHPSHRAILSALAERGPSVANNLGVGIASDIMHILVGRGWCFRVARTNEGIRSAWMYDLTEAGRKVLEIGLVPKLVQAPNVELKRSRAHWQNVRGEATPLLNGCCHHYVLDAHSVGRCRKCGVVKAFPTGLSLVAKEIARA